MTSDTPPEGSKPVSIPIEGRDCALDRCIITEKPATSKSLTWYSTSNLKGTK